MAGQKVTMLLFLAMLATDKFSANAETPPKGVNLSFPPVTSKFTCSLDPALKLNPKFICTPTTNPTSIAFSWDDGVTSARYQYKTPVQLWKKNSKYVASFSTSYTVNFDRDAEYTVFPLFGGGGVAFAITPSLSVVGTNTESIGLFAINEKTGASLAGSNSKTVAVELDVSRNGESWDPEIPHVGLDINSVKSVRTKYLGDPDKFRDHKVGVFIDYNALTGTIQVRIHKVNVNQTPDKKKSEVAITYTGLDLAVQVKEFSYVGFATRTPETTKGIYMLYDWKFSTTWVLGSKINH